MGSPSNYDSLVCRARYTIGPLFRYCEAPFACRCRLPAIKVEPAQESLTPAQIRSVWIVTHCGQTPQQHLPLRPPPC